MERFLRYYEQLLACICENPAQPIRQMNYLPEKERHQLLYEWSGKTDQPAGPLLITERFEAQVKRHLMRSPSNRGIPVDVSGVARESRPACCLFAAARSEAA